MAEPEKTVHARPELTVWASGKPRPKGSLDLIESASGKTSVKENNPATTPWRRHVNARLRAALADHRTELEAGYARALGEDRALWPTRVFWPLEEPVGVRLRFLFRRPGRPKFGVPATRETGDVDKLARNILDAMTDAGVIKDDSLVCDLDATARYAPEGGMAGALIEVYQLTAWRI